MSLSDRLNQIIKEKNITKREFANRVGISETTFISSQATAVPGQTKTKPSHQCLLNSLVWSLVMMRIGYCTENKNKSRFIAKKDVAPPKDATSFICCKG